MKGLMFRFFNLMNPNSPRRKVKRLMKKMGEEKAREVIREILADTKK